jgi:aryl-alcohol dehydrogenase-like predicted oxidoreductase
VKNLALGRSEVAITPIIMGTWQAGKSQWGGIRDSEIKKAICTAFELGITTFDTAPLYGGGHSERAIANTLSDVRHHVIYASKIPPSHLRYDKVIEACHQSLKNLKTDYIDLYQIHWPAGSFGSKNVPIEETMGALATLKVEGKIRAFGVSNFSIEQLKSANHSAPIDSAQPPYSLFWRHAEQSIIPYCVEKGITVLAYAPMAQGLLTGKFGHGHRFPKGDHRARNRLFQSDHFARAQKALIKLQAVADRLEITLGQLALAWVLSQKGTCAIAGARNPEQVRQNVKATQVVLSDEILREMDTISHSVTDHLDDNPILWR